MKPRDIITTLSSLLVVAIAIIVVLLKSRPSPETTAPSPEVASSQSQNLDLEKAVEAITAAKGEEAKEEGVPVDVYTEQPEIGGTRNVQQNGPRKTERVIWEGSYFQGVWISIDEGMPLLDYDLLDDDEFHAYADVSRQGRTSQWIPISVNAYNAKTGLIHIRPVPGGEVTIPLQGRFLLTRVPK